MDNLKVRNSSEKMTYALCSITHRKTPNLPEITWFEWPFWCFFVGLLFGLIMNKHLNFHLLFERKNWAALPQKFFQDWSLIWSIYIPVWLKYLHSPSLCKKTLFCWFFKIRSNGKFQNTQWELSQRTRVRFSISLYSDFKINRRIFVSREKWSGDIMD